MSIIKQLQPLAQICSKLSLLHEQYLQPAHGMNQKIKKNPKMQRAWNSHHANKSTYKSFSYKENKTKGHIKAVLGGKRYLEEKDS